MKKQVKTITIWSDYACPYCYIGEKRLKDALKALNVEDEFKFEYRAFELDPNAPIKPEGNIDELLAAKYGITVEKAKKNIEHIDNLGKELGINMKFGTSLRTNTFDAHRLMKFAETEYEQVVAEAFNNALFDAYFTKNLNLADRKVLLNMAENCAIDGNQAKEVLDQDLYANDVRYDEKEAQMRGIQGVPYIVFDGRIAVPGAVSTNDFKAVVREVLENKNDERHAQGPSCDETGCKI